MAKSEFTNKLLREAIADAEAVRQTAIENAKLSLEETFTPQIKSMLSRRLRAEAEGTEYADGMHTDAEEKHDEKKAHEKHMAEDAKETPFQDAEGETKSKEVPMDSSEIGDADNKVPSSEADDSSEIGDGPESHHDGETDWYDDWSESDFDLDEVIKELEEDMKAFGKEEGEEEEMDESWSEGKEEEGEEEEAEEENEAYPAEKPEAGTLKPDVPPHSSDIGKDEAHTAADINKFVTDPSTPKLEDGAEMKGHEEEGEEEELDLEAILKELEAEEDEKMKSSEEMAALQKELAEYRKAVQLLRGKLNEVNLLNAKLLYTNKIFRKEGLTNEQKVNIVESFDRASTVREVKMVYTVLVETLTSTAKVLKATKSPKKVVAEGLASKATPSTAPKSETTEILAENSVAKRLQQLAGLI
jgi:hypothetical protein